MPTEIAGSLVAIGTVGYSPRQSLSLLWREAVAWPRKAVILTLGLSLVSL